MPDQSFLLLRILAATALLMGSPFMTLLAPPSARPARIAAFAEWGLVHPIGYGLCTAAALFAQVIVCRLALHLWYNVIRPRIAGTRSRETAHTFPVRNVDALGRILATRKDPALAGNYFIGDEPPAHRRGKVGAAHYQIG